MTHTASTTVVCGHCGTATNRALFGHPWCQPCGIWLVPDHTGTTWVSFAECARRRDDADTAAAIATSAAQVDAAVEPVRRLLPAGWHLSIRQFPGARHQLTIDPPQAALDATAYLTPTIDRHGWGVRVHNRHQNIDYPLFQDGGKRAATYPTAEAAAHAAIDALRVDMTPGTPTP